MNWTPTVSQITDGQEVSAAVVNTPLSELVQRTDYLYQRIQDTAHNASLVALAQPIANGSGVAQWSVVYFDGVDLANPGLKLASPKVSTLSDHPFFRGADSAHVFGIVKTEPSAEDTVDVHLQGLIKQEGIVTSLLYPADASFRSGPLYLSSLQDGKLAQAPNGLAIYVGYANSRDEIYINPNQESLSELFWTFKYSLVDRPAGRVSFDGEQWTITAVENSKVGWIPASERLTNEELAVMFPGKVPKYFYQLPDPGAISANNPELAPHERQAAANLHTAFPAWPNTLSFLTINGVVYSPKEAPEDENLFVLNELGIWWFAGDYDDEHDDGEFEQPWAPGLQYSLRGQVPTVDEAELELVDPTGAEITNLTTHPGFEVGKTVRFFAGEGGTLPTPLSAATDYVISEVEDGHIKVEALAFPGVDIVLSDAGTGNWYLRWEPSFWSAAKGEAYLRPLMSIQFSKINPDVRQNVVTSLKSDSTVTSPAIAIRSQLTEEAAATGDLSLKLTLPVVNGWDGNTASLQQGKAVKGVRYDNAQERLELALGNVVTELRNGGGIKIDSDPITGVVTVSASGVHSNGITNLEPEQARLDYFGLHSYLSLDYENTPSGFVGKFVLPDQIVGAGTGNLSIVLRLLGVTSTVTSRRNVQFKFEYSVGRLNSALTANVTTRSLVVVQLPGPNYIPNTMFETPLTTFQIPLSELSPRATVNFRVHRIQQAPTTNLYTGKVGVVAAHWALS